MTKPTVSPESRAVTRPTVYGPAAAAPQGQDEKFGPLARSEYVPLTYKTSPGKMGEIGRTK